MKEAKIITGADAVARMRNIKLVPGATFGIRFITCDLNRAIHINFPYAKKQGIKLGFWIDIPSKLSDTTVSERPAGAATAEN